MFEAIRNPNRKFGIEIECFLPGYASVGQLRIQCATRGLVFYAEGYNHTARNHWKGVGDGSIIPTGNGYGIEIVSPPLQGAEGLQQVKTMCECLALVGARVNRSCGLHVHHDAADFERNPVCFKRILKLYQDIEVYIDHFCPPSRRGSTNHYCMSMIGVNMHRWNYTRYYKLNRQSLERHGTLEFRQHSATIEAEKIVAWIHLTQSLMEHATLTNRSCHPAEHRTLWDHCFPPKINGTPISEELKKVNKAVKAYFDKRAREFGFAVKLHETAPTATAPAETGEMAHPRVQGELPLGNNVPASAVRNNARRNQAALNAAADRRVALRAGIPVVPAVPVQQANERHQNVINQLFGS